MPTLTPEQWKILEYLAWGGASGLIGSMTKSRRMTLPHLTCIRERDGRVVKGFDWGFLAAPLLGAVVAAAVDGRPSTAIAYGLACGYAGPSLLNLIVDWGLGKLGLMLGGLPSQSDKKEALP